MNKKDKSKKRKLDDLSGIENKSETKHKKKRRNTGQFKDIVEIPIEEKPTEDSPEQPSPPDAHPTEEKPIKDNPNSDYKEYWSVDSITRRDPGSFLKLNISMQDLMGNLPVYIDKGGSINQNLGPFFSNRRSPHRILSICGIPGLGKTVTVQAFARLHNCTYLRIMSHCGITAQMICQMDLVCLQKMTMKELRLKLDYISINTIRALLQDASDVIKAKKFIPNNEKSYLNEFIEKGVLALPFGEELQTKVQQAKEELLQCNSIVLQCSSTLHTEDIVVVHFDECQSWASPQYKRKMDDEIIEDETEAHMYRLISFSECLAYAPSNFRFAFTGTHIWVDSILRFESKMKLVPSDVKSVTTIEDVKYLLNLFVDVTKIDDKVISQLVGPYRIVQLFLKWLYSGQTVEEAKESAYREWTIFPSQLMKDFKDKFPAADSVLLFFFAYNEYQGKKNADGTITIPTKAIDKSWQNWVQHSIIIMKEIESKYSTGGCTVQITPPFPFLVRLLLSQTVLFDFTHIRGLMHHHSSNWTVASSPAHGNLFQWALPVELMLPNSPILAEIVKCLQKRYGTKNVTFAKFQPKIGTFVTEEEAIANTKGNYISVLLDAELNTKFKVGNLCFPVTVDGKQIHVRAEAKLYGSGDATTSTLQSRRECLEFFQKAEAIRDIQVAIFFCWTNMQMNEKQAELVAELDKFLTKKQKRFIIIDNMQKMNFVLDIASLCSPKEGDTTATFCEKLMSAKKANSYDQNIDNNNKINERLVMKTPANIAIEVLKKVDHQIPEEVASELCYRILIKEEGRLINALVALQNTNLEVIAEYCKNYIPK